MCVARDMHVEQRRDHAAAQERSRCQRLLSCARTCGSGRCRGHGCQCTGAAAEADCLPPEVQGHAAIWLVSQRT